MASIPSRGSISQDMSSAIVLGSLFILPRSFGLHGTGIVAVESFFDADKGFAAPGAVFLDLLALQGHESATL